MPMSERQAEALAIYNRVGNKTAVSREMGVNESTARRLINKALSWQEAEPGHVAAIEATGLDITQAKHGWRIVQHPDGSRDSVFWKRDEPEIAPQSLADAIKEALSDVEPAPKSVQKDSFTKNTCCVFPVADLHMGLLTDFEEVGNDWDTKKAVAVFEKTFGALVARTPNAEVAVLAQLGDLTHNDDQRNVTPQSGHQLDVDSRYFMIVRRAVSVMKWAIDSLRKKYPRVVYRGCRGNHDMTTHIAVTIALSEHYRGCDDVEIIDSASEFYCHQYGKNMFVFHHGDRAKPERLLPFVANEWPEMWGTTKHRVAFSGHVHHEWAKELAGMLFRSIGTIVPRDVHAFSNAYGSNRCLMSFTYDKLQGEVASARVNL